MKRLTDIPETRPRQEAARQDEPPAADVLYASDDVVITAADVEAAIEEGRERMGDEFAALLRAGRENDDEGQP